MELTKAELRKQLEAELREELRAEMEAERKAIAQKVRDYEQSFDSAVAERRKIGVRVFAELSRKQRFQQARDALEPHAFALLTRMYAAWRADRMRRHEIKHTFRPSDQRVRTKAFDKPDPQGWAPDPCPEFRGAIPDSTAPLQKFRKSRGPFARPRFTDYERACVKSLSGPPCADLLPFTEPGESMSEDVYWSVRYTVPGDPKTRIDFVMTAYPEDVASSLEPGAVVTTMRRVKWTGGVTDPEPSADRYPVYSIKEYMSWTGSPPVFEGQELCAIVRPFPVTYPVTMFTPKEFDGARNLYAKSKVEGFMQTLFRSPFDDLEAKGRDSKYYGYAMDRIRPRKLCDYASWPHRAGNLKCVDDIYTRDPIRAVLDHYLAGVTDTSRETMAHALERCAEMRDHGIAFDGVTYTAGRRTVQVMTAVESRLDAAQTTYLLGIYPGDAKSLTARMIAGPAPDDPRTRHAEVFALAVSQVYANFKSALARETKVKARKIYDDEQRQRRYESERAESRFNSADDRAMRSPHRLLEIQQNLFRGRFRSRFAEGERYINRYTHIDAVAYDTDSAYHMAHYIWFFVCFRGIHVLAVVEDKAAQERFADLINWFNDAHVRRKSLGCVFIRTADQVAQADSDDTEVFTSSFLDIRTVEQVRTAKFQHVLDSRGDFAVVFDGFSKFYGTGKTSLTGKFLERAVNRSVSLMVRAGRTVTSVVKDGTRRVRVPVKKSEWVASVLDIDQDFTDDVKIDAEDNGRLYPAARFLTPHYVNNVYRYLESCESPETTIVTLNRSPVEFNRLALHLERGVVTVDHLGTSTFGPVMTHDPEHADDIYYSQRNMFLGRANNRAKGGAAEIRNWYADGNDSLVVLARVDTMSGLTNPVHVTLTSGDRVVRKVRTHICSEAQYLKVRTMYPDDSDVKFVVIPETESPGYVIPVFGDGKVEKSLGATIPDPQPFGEDDIGEDPEESDIRNISDVKAVEMIREGKDPDDELSDADKVRMGKYEKVSRLEEMDQRVVEKQSKAILLTKSGDAPGLDRSTATSSAASGNGNCTGQPGPNSNRDHVNVARSCEEVPGAIVSPIGGSTLSPEDRKELRRIRRNQKARKRATIRKYHPK